MSPLLRPQTNAPTPITASAAFEETGRRPLPFMSAAILGLAPQFGLMPPSFVPLSGERSQFWGQNDGREAASSDVIRRSPPDAETGISLRFGCTWRCPWRASQTSTSAGSDAERFVIAEVEEPGLASSRPWESSSATAAASRIQGTEAEFPEGAGAPLPTLGDDVPPAHPKEGQGLSSAEALALRSSVFLSSHMSAMVLMHTQPQEREPQCTR
ncbi:hypothetical protein HPB47_001381 [Ixodes persulcatus]|uniref:Uncharacterized protein n=1 Tax=Ixodes persulcatus TaxID=34615 RepID=A0AC60PP57_IXOPE|nr:hypothetical protein HPB47_001381 [Ixodes persulcatus]